MKKKTIKGKIWKTQAKNKLRQSYWKDRLIDVLNFEQKKLQKLATRVYQAVIAAVGIRLRVAVFIKK